MKKNKKILYLFLTLVSSISLVACTTPQKESDNKSKTTQSSTKKETKKSILSDEKKKSMDFSKISLGDYSSLEGDWKEILVGANHVPGKTGMQYTKGGSDILSISRGVILNNAVYIYNKTLTDNNNSQNLVFKEKNNVLYGSLEDQSSAINWSITFYPKGTTTEYDADNKTGKNSVNLIVLWTSNNQLTQVFAQTSTQTSGMNIAAIAYSDFSSLVGTWKNPIDGKSISITEKTEKKPAESNFSQSVGAIVSGFSRNGHNEVVTSGPVNGAYIQGGIGYFDPSIRGSAFSPLLIVPRNIKIGENDDSDSTRDRLILGGGQSGFGTQSYYKEK